MNVRRGIDSKVSWTLALIVIELHPEQPSIEPSIGNNATDRNIFDTTRNPVEITLSWGKIIIGITVSPKTRNFSIAEKTGNRSDDNLMFAAI